MSLQDDYFDVMHALEGKPEKEAFERIWKRFCGMEGTLDRLEPLSEALDTLKQSVKNWWAQ